MPLPETRGSAVELTFEGFVQDEEEYGSGPEVMVSRVFFWIRQRTGPGGGDFFRDLAKASGNRFAKSRIEPPREYSGPMLHADLRQPVGDDFQSGRIEVSPPVGYSEPFPQAAFARAAVEYFRSRTSETGAMFRLEDGKPLRGGPRETAHVRLRHNVEASRQTVRLDAPPASPGIALGRNP
jgi:hypothetical protein